VSRASAIYEGTVTHRRAGSIEHRFSYPLQMMYIDLGELRDLFDGHLLWSPDRPNLAWFRRADYLGDPSEPLEQSVRDLVGQETGMTPPGPVRLLTHMRRFGQNFNPVSFYYCFDADEETLIATVAEVTSTPWGERHAYVVPRGRAHELRKAMHVSPLLAMDHTYAVHAPAPGDALRVRISAGRGGRTTFSAALRLERREITGRELARALIRHPVPATAVRARIYWQALRLRLKGAAWHPRPAGVQP
jgi:DUF1365 family protein